MVKIINIHKSGQIVSMNCLKEGNPDESFYMEMDSNTFEIVSDTPDNMYSSQARSKIRYYLQNMIPFPDEIVSVWY